MKPNFAAPPLNNAMVNKYELLTVRGVDCRVSSVASKCFKQDFTCVVFLTPLEKPSCLHTRSASSTVQVPASHTYTLHMKCYSTRDT